MALNPIYFKPQSNTRARSTSILSFNGSVVVACFDRPSLFSISGSALVETQLSDLLSNGFGDMVNGDNNDLWLASYDGYLINCDSEYVLTQYEIDSGEIATGCAMVSGSPYFVTSEGDIRACLSGVITSIDSGFESQARGLYAYQNILYSLLCSSVAVGQLTLTSPTSGSVVSDDISGLMDMPYCMTVSASGDIAVGGMTFSAIASGYASLTESPAVSGIAIGVLYNNYIINLLSQSTVPNWTVDQAINTNGDATASDAKWSPDGTQVLVLVTDGIQVFNYSSGILSYSATISLTGASALAVFEYGTDVLAMVCQQSQDQISILKVSGGVWSSWKTVSITNPACIAYDSYYQEVAVGTTLSITWLSYVEATDTWDIDTVVTTSATPSAIGYDEALNMIFYGGAASGTAYVSAFLNKELSGRTSWVGNAFVATSVNGQIIALDSDNDMIVLVGFLQESGSFGIANTYKAMSSVSAIGILGETVFISTTDAAWLARLEAPYCLERFYEGMLAIGLSDSVSLGNGQVPTALTFDDDGNVYAATIKNELFKIDPGLNVLSQDTIPVYTGQTEGILLGISRLLWTDNKLYAATSLTGFVIRLI